MTKIIIKFKYDYNDKIKDIDIMVYFLGTWDSQIGKSVRPTKERTVRFSLYK